MRGNGTRTVGRRIRKEGLDRERSLSRYARRCARDFTLFNQRSERDRDMQEKREQAQFRPSHTTKMAAPSSFPRPFSSLQYSTTKTSKKKTSPFRACTPEGHISPKKRGGRLGEVFQMEGAANTSKKPEKMLDQGKGKRFKFSPKISNFPAAKNSTSFGC